MTLEPFPYWWETAPPSGLADAELPSHSDVVVIGAGYTELSAALTLATRRSLPHVGGSARSTSLIVATNAYTDGPVRHPVSSLLQRQPVVPAVGVTLVSGR